MHFNSQLLKYLKTKRKQRFKKIPNLLNYYTLFFSIRFRKALLHALVISQLGWQDQSVNMHIP